MENNKHHIFHAQRFLLLILSFTVVFLAPQRAAAECTDKNRQEIWDINHKAMESYQNMAFKKARQDLRSAFKYAEENQCTYDWIHAMTLMNLGILCGGGLGKKKLAYQFFLKALRTRPQAPLEKVFATPTLRKIYRRARKRLRITEAPKPWPKLDVPPPQRPRPRPAASPPSLPLEHEPVDQAPQGNPIRLTCRVSEEVAPKSVLISYRPYKSSRFKTIKMKKTDKPWTWQGKIPAKAVWGRSLQYYIHADTQSDQVVATSGSLISPHIIEIVSAGGKSDAENPFLKKKTPLQKKSGKTRFWVQVGPSFGVGLARGQVEVIDEQGGVAVQTGQPLDRIEEPGMALGSLGGVAEFGYFVLPKLLLSVRGRFGYIGMFTKNVEGAAIADFSASVRARYFVLSFYKNWFSLYTGGGLGYAQIRHAVDLELAGGNYTDTDMSKGVAPSGFGGLTIGKSKLVRGYVETGFMMTIWNDADLFTFHLDFNAGVCFSF